MQGLQYRVAAIAGLATQFFWGFMLILVLAAFQRGATGASPMSLPQMASYIWLQQGFLVLVALWYRDGGLLETITSGQVAYELCRPVDLYALWFARLIAGRIAGAMLRCLPIFAIAFLLPDPYRLQLPRDPATFAAFLAAMTIGLAVNVAISLFVYILTFVTMNPAGPMILIMSLGEFLAGLILPVPLMPDWLQRVVMVLPFRLAADFPFRVWTGLAVGEDMMWGFLAQVLWLVVLVVIGHFLMGRVLRRAVVQGG